MKRLLYSLWLAVGAIVCSSCADYLDVVIFSVPAVYALFSCSMSF